MIEWCWKEWERREFGDALIHQGQALSHAGVCCSLVGVMICPEIPKRGRPRWKVGTKICKELERGLTAKICGVTVGPQLCSLLVLALQSRDKYICFTVVHEIWLAAG